MANEGVTYEARGVNTEHAKVLLEAYRTIDGRHNGTLHGQKASVLKKLLEVLEVEVGEK